MRTITQIIFKYARYYQTPDKTGWKKVARDDNGKDLGPHTEADSTLIEALIVKSNSEILIFNHLQNEFARQGGPYFLTSE